MKRIVLAPFSMHKGLLEKYRKEDVFVECKLLTKEELVSSFFFSYKKEAKARLMEEFDLNPSKATRILSYLPFITDFNDEGVSNYEKYFKYLDSNNLLKRNSYFKILLNNADAIDNYYYKEDKIIKFIFENNKKINHISYGNEISTDRVEMFVDADEETNYVLNSICTLIQNGVSTDDIYIYVSNEDYLYYLEKYGAMYSLKFNGLKGEKLLFNKVSALFFSYFKQNDIDLEMAKDHVLSIINDEKNFDKIYNVLTENYYEFLAKDKQIKLFEYALSNEYSDVDKYSNSVKIITEPIYGPFSHLFIMNFAANVFPKTYGDDDDIRDKNKGNHLLATAEEKNEEERYNCIRLLKSTVNVYVSFSNTSTNNKFYPTSFIKELNFEKNYTRSITKYFSEQYLKILLAKKLDLYKLYKNIDETYLGLVDLVDIPYYTYTNIYKNIGINNSTKRFRFSYTSLDTFFGCPFRYYLDNYFDINDLENNFIIDRGNIAHAILEKCLEPNFNFDSEYHNQLNKPEYSYFSKKELLYMDIIKEQIRNACAANKLHLTYMKNPSFIIEHNFQPLQINELSTLVGKADKILISDKSKYIVIDYKTGTTTFDPKYLHVGKGLQLPIYSLLCKNDPSLNKMEITGLYINNIIDKKYDPEFKDDNLIEQHLKLNGFTLYDYNSVLEFDNTISGGKSEFISGITSKDGVLKGKKSLISEEEFNKYMKIAEELIVAAEKDIRNNNFDIKPLFINNDNRGSACEYCSYRDICYLRSSQKIRPIEEDESDE